MTGAGSGIGRATATRLAEEGASVVVADIDREAGRRTAERIVDAGGEAVFVAVDVTDRAAVEGMVEAAVERFGGLDIAVNNAGILTGFDDVTAITEGQWDRIVDVNLKGVWTCLQATLPVIERTGGGAVVNTASEAGLVGMGGLSSYAATKHGVVGLTKSVALEYARRDVRVNAVAPGPTRTNIQESFLGSGDTLGGRLRQTIGLVRTAVDTMTADYDTSAMREVPMDRTAAPEEVAAAIVFLCSEEASYITGHTLPVDGGQAAD